MSDTAPCLNATGLTKDFHSGSETVHAVREVSLQVRPGELVLLVGSSGSGKSTLLHMLAGLETPTAGTVQVEDRTLTWLSPAQVAAVRLQFIGVVFQDGNLIDELTAAENVSLPLEVARMSRAAARRDAERALDLVGLSGLGARLPSELSGGQRQRVAVARALVGDRRILLADEPTGSLDTATGQQVIDSIRRTCDAGAAVVVATHDLRHTRVADRVLEMSDGAILPSVPAVPNDPEQLWSDHGVQARGEADQR